MRDQNSGFLLIGLLIVVAIIAIIFTVMNGENKKGTTNNLQSQKNQAQTQLENTNVELNEYQKNLENQ